MFASVFLWLIMLPLAVVWLALLWWLFRRRARVVFVMALVVPPGAYEVFQYGWFADALPARIAVTWPVSITDEGDCGSAVYRLSDETLALVRKEGLGFFRDATHERGHPDDRHHGYAAWQETPVPEGWTSEGLWMCSTLGDDTSSRILAAAKRSGAYYTTGHGSQLIVFPELGYVVLSFGI